MNHPVSLIISETEIGAYRAHRIFQMCRHFAQKIDPRCYIMADYVNHERVGWTFEMHSEVRELQLRLYHQTIMSKPLF